MRGMKISSRWLTCVSQRMLRRARRWSMVAALTVLVGYPTPVGAHDGAPVAPHDLWRAWNWDPAILIALALSAAVYMLGVRTLWQRLGTGRVVRRRQAAASAGALLALVIALVSPLDALAAALFSAHMVQHLLLILVAAPLLVVSEPLLPFLWTVNKERRRQIGRWWRQARAIRAGLGVLTRPLVAWGFHVAVLWAWHAPKLYEAALGAPPLHALEHATLLGSAVLFWWAIFRTGKRATAGYGAGVLYVFATALQGGVLGALITFASTPWYRPYSGSTAGWGFSALEDQQLAGLIMWVLGGIVYLLIALVLFAAWLGSAARQVQRREEQGWHSLPPSAPESHGAAGVGRSPG